MGDYNKRVPYTHATQIPQIVQFQCQSVNASGTCYFLTLPITRGKINAITHVGEVKCATYGCIVCQSI